MMMRRLVVIVVTLVAGIVGYYAGTQSQSCRYVVTDDAEFVHLGKNSIVILSPNTVKRMFGPRAGALTLFYGSNRMLTDTGQSAIVRSPLLAMSRSVRALFFSGDDWRDLLVPVHALETKEQVLLRINLQTHEIVVGQIRSMAHARHSVSADGTLVVRP
jgi:hypothetical protein